MKRSKLFMAIGSLILTTMAFLTAKSNKKLTTHTGYVFSYPGIVVVSSANLTKTDNNRTCFFQIGNEGLNIIRTTPIVPGAPLYYKD